jgi:hypothetical protein
VPLKSAYDTDIAQKRARDRIDVYLRRNDITSWNKKLDVIHLSSPR